MHKTKSEAHAIRILLVDDHHMLRQGLKALLEQRGEMTIVGESKRCVHCAIHREASAVLCP